MAIFPGQKTGNLWEVGGTIDNEVFLVSFVSSFVFFVNLWIVKSRLHKEHKGTQRTRRLVRFLIFKTVYVDYQQ
jgi:hypothetical protein